MEVLSRQDVASHRDEAVARASAYLCSLGLPASRAAEEAKAFLEQCAAADVASDDAASGLARVTSEYDAWLTYLSRSGDGDKGCDPGLLAWHLGAVLAENPDGFLRRGELPEPLQLAVEASAQPAVPRETPTPMPAQAIGHLPAIFHRHLWHALAEWVATVGHRLDAD